MAIEVAVGVGLTLAFAAGVVLLLWRVLRMRVTEVKGRPERPGPAEYVSDKDITELLANDIEPEEKGEDGE